MPMLAITTSLITHSPAATRRNDFPINITAQRCGDLLGFTSLSVFKLLLYFDKRWIELLLRSYITFC